MLTEVVASDEAYFDELREREFSRLARADEAYLDYTGSALYTDSQVRAHAALLADGLFGNPHSEHRASRASTAVIDEARRRALAWLDADEESYDVCFTANATAAIKLVAESYLFGPDVPLVLTADNHNSVNGMREYAARRGSRVFYLPLDEQLRLADPVGRLGRLRRQSGLLAFPAQSNFSGVQHLPRSSLGSGTWVRRLAGRRVISARTRPKPAPASRRLRDALVLQDVRLFPPASARWSRVATRWLDWSAVVCRRHRGLRLGATRNVPAARGARRVRGRHAQFSRHRGARCRVRRVEGRVDAATDRSRRSPDARAPRGPCRNAPFERRTPRPRAWPGLGGRSWRQCGIHALDVRWPPHSLLDRRGSCRRRPCSRPGRVFCNPERLKPPSNYPPPPVPGVLNPATGFHRPTVQRVSWRYHPRRRDPGFGRSRNESSRR